jgi:hypothetical protein
LLGGIVTAVILLAVWKGWSNDEQAIRTLLNRLAGAASMQPSESGLARLTYGDRLAGFFTTNATLNLEVLGGEFTSVHGRAELAQAALGVRNTLREADFKVTDVDITFPGEKGTAKVYVVITGHIQGGPASAHGRLEDFAQAFRMMLHKTQGHWRIEEVKALEQVK